MNRKLHTFPPARFLVCLALATLIPPALLVARPRISTVLHSETEKEILFSFNLGQTDYLYQDTIYIHSDHPALRVHKWRVSIDPTLQFDPLFKERKTAYRGAFQLVVLVEQMEPLEKPGNLLLTYYQKSNHRMHQIVLPVPFTSPKSEPTTEQSAATHDQLQPKPVGQKSYKKRGPERARVHALVSLYLLALLMAFWFCGEIIKASWQLLPGLLLICMGLIHSTLESTWTLHTPLLGLYASSLLAGGIYLKKKGRNRPQQSVAEFIIVAMHATSVALFLLITFRYMYS